MNTRYIYVIVLLLITVTSCYKDLSETADKRFENVITNNADHPSNSSKESYRLLGYFGDKFVFNPKLSIAGEDTVDIKPENFSYEWKISLTASNDTLAEVIGHEKELSFEINMVGPNTYPYDIFLRVTDKVNNVKYLFNWELKVLSNYGQGILVAETSDDITTDISLLMARECNDDFTDEDEDRIVRNLYSSVNSTKLDGIVTQLTYLSYGKNKTIYALVKDQHLYGIDPLSYVIQNKDLDFFTFAPRKFKPEAIQINMRGGCYFINDGCLHFFEMRRGQKYSYVDFGSDDRYSSSFYSDNSGAYYFGKVFYGPIVLFNEAKGKFAGMNNYGSFGNYTSSPANEFDPTNIQNQELVYGAATPNNGFRAIMKSKTDDVYSVYEMSADEAKTPKKPLGNSIYDMSLCPDLKDAVGYFFQRESDELFYAVGNQLKVAIMNKPQPTASVVYTLPVGENITVMRVPEGRMKGKTTWGEAPNDDTGVIEPVWRSSQYNMVILASYDSAKGEGTIRTLPIEYAGSGTIAPDKYVKSYTGFSRITALAFQY